MAAMEGPGRRRIVRATSSFGPAIGSVSGVETLGESWSRR